MSTYPPPEWSSIAVGDAWVRLVRSGPHQASEAVVFIHGNPGSAGDWAGLVETVGGIRRAVAFDLPDFGQSVAASGFGHTVGEYADFIEEALETLGISHVHLVLHDFGGPIGLAWAARNLERVTGVTLIDTGILQNYRWHRMARVWQTPLLGELAQAVTSRAIFRRVIRSAEPRGLPLEFVDEMYENYDRRTRNAVLNLYRSAKSVGKHAGQVVPLFAAADIPALVIWGAQDPYLGSEFAERQREAFPSAEIHVLADSGHWPFIDDPITVSRLLTDFLGTTE